MFLLLNFCLCLYLLRSFTWIYSQPVHGDVFNFVYKPELPQRSSIGVHLFRVVFITEITLSYLLSSWRLDPIHVALQCWVNSCTEIRFCPRMSYRKLQFRLEIVILVKVFLVTVTSKIFCTGWSLEQFVRICILGIF